MYLQQIKGSCGAGAQHNFYLSEESSSGDRRYRCLLCRGVIYQPRTTRFSRLLVGRIFCDEIVAGWED